MNSAAALLAPLLLLLPAATALAPQPEAAPGIGEPAGRLTAPMSTPAGAMDRSDGGDWLARLESFSTDRRQQVSIEEHIIIRISPRPRAAAPAMLADLPGREVGTHFEERRMGRCLAMAGIAGVQVSGDDRLILFMRDNRIISAALERACHARDFYSGFLVQRTADGMLCSDRDKLQSRAGANCAVTRMRQLVEVDE